VAAFASLVAPPLRGGKPGLRQRLPKMANFPKMPA
jgi:hypothetical protein